MRASPIFILWEKMAGSIQQLPKEQSWRPLPAARRGPVHRHFQTNQLSAAINTYGTVQRVCVAEALRLILTPHGVEDDEETRHDEGPCCTGC